MSRWRLPTLHELFSTFDHEKGKSTINGFNSDFYWSSTTHINDTNSAWIVGFGYGYIYDYRKSHICYVRCVRGAEDGKLEWSKPSKEKMTWEKACEYCERINNE